MKSCSIKILIVFSVLSATIDTTGNADITGLLQTIDTTFNISPYLFIVPAVVIILILFKTKPLIALLSGVVLAAVFSVIFQAEVLEQLADSQFTAISNAILTDTNITTDNEKLNELLGAVCPNSEIVINESVVI